MDIILRSLAIRNWNPQGLPAVLTTLWLAWRGIDEGKLAGVVAESRGELAAGEFRGGRRALLYLPLAWLGDALFEYRGIFVATSVCTLIVAAAGHVWLSRILPREGEGTHER